MLGSIQGCHAFVSVSVCVYTIRCAEMHSLPGAASYIGMNVNYEKGTISLENIGQVLRYIPLNSTFKSPARKGTQVQVQTRLHRS